MATAAAIAVALVAGLAASAASAPRTVTTRAIDGGAGYYSRFSSSLPADDSFFPIGVWFESVTQASDVQRDLAAGLNTYVQLTDNSDLSLARKRGLHVLATAPTADDPSIAGWVVSDEVDMRFGPGWSAVQKDDGDYECAPGQDDCGYTLQRALRADLPSDGRLRYSNYGKGVTFWEDDRDARVFVNRFQDVVSVDNYWFTDPNICGGSEGGALLADGKPLSDSQCRRASNYGATIDRVRSLVRPAGSKPVWAFVEVGHPFSEDDAPTITPPEVRAAVWSSLIHGARGIIYFNHSFGGKCETQHALREPCYHDVRAVVTRTNAQITELAPVLNSPTVSGVTSTSGAVDTMTKWYDGSYYVFVGSRRASDQNVTVKLACTGDATAVALGESRSIPITGGAFKDDFADGNAVHLYRIDGAATCSPG